MGTLGMLVRNCLGNIFCNSIKTISVKSHRPKLLREKKEGTEIQEYELPERQDLDSKRTL